MNCSLFFTREMTVLHTRYPVPKTIKARNKPPYTLLPHSSNAQWPFLLRSVVWNDKTVARVWMLSWQNATFSQTLFVTHFCTQHG